MELHVWNNFSVKGNIFCSTDRVCDRWRRGEETAWLPSWKAHDVGQANTYGGLLLSHQHDYLAITPHTITLYSDHYEESPFLVSGRNILINMGAGQKDLVDFWTNNWEIISLHQARNISYWRLVGGWVVCGGRPGSHRTSGLSMPQTPTTERCATWDCGDHRTGDTGDTGLMSDVSHYCSLLTAHSSLHHFSKHVTS